MLYELFRLHVVAKSQLTLFINQKIDEKDAESQRREHLKNCFASERAFIHKGKKFYFKPIFENSGVSGGVFARNISDQMHEGPEENFAELETTGWHIVNFFLDLNEGPSNQLLAIGFDRQVGKPYAFAKSFIDNLNSAFLESPWDITIYPMPSEEDFFKSANEYSGNITEIEFIFSVPNPLGIGISDSLDDELKQARDEENAQQVVNAVRNAEGNINASSYRIKTAVDAISKGAARGKMKSGKQTIYDSERKNKQVEVNDNRSLKDMSDAGFMEIFSKIVDRWRS